MSDFYQDHQITTLHRLARRPLEEFEAGLELWASRNRMALLLPCLVTEMDGPALPAILEHLKHVHYIHRVVVALDAADEEGFRRALKFFAPLPQETTILWLDGPRGRALFAELADSGLVERIRGKGQAVWFALGYLLGVGDCRGVALHDCDILTYDRFLLGRLCFPVLRPDIGFKFAKAYYARISDRLNGRVCRLFVFPLLAALRSIFPGQPFLEFLAAFRYPLAGEMALELDLARHVRIPSDWGLEVGLLAEVYRYLAPKQICQMDIAGRYDHKHQQLIHDDPERGLLRMVCDITSSILSTLASQGVQLNPGVLSALEAAYLRTAQEYVERYAFDALINGFVFDRHQEELAMESFARGLIRAGENYLLHRRDSPLLPNWNRIEAALPELPGRLAMLPFEDRRDLGV